MTYSQAVRWAAKNEPNNEGVMRLISEIYRRNLSDVEARIHERKEYKIVDGRKQKR